MTIEKKGLERESGFLEVNSICHRNYLFMQLIDSVVATLITISRASTGIGGAAAAIPVPARLMVIKIATMECCKTFI